LNEITQGRSSYFVILRGPTDQGGLAGQGMEVTIHTKMLVGERNNKRNVGVAAGILLRLILSTR
jgi:hypothetical protein